MMIKVNGIDLYYQKSGAGEPLILLHGNGEDHHIFDELIVKLQLDFTVYAIDSRNHGESEKTAEYGYDMMAADLIDFIYLLQLERVNVVGFSDGAIIALLVAMQSPSLFNKMALLGVNLSPDDFTDESLNFIKYTYAQTEDPLFKMMLEQPNIELESLTSISIPTLVVGAEHDIYKPALFTTIAQTLPNATLKIVQNHDHGSYIIHQYMLYPDLIAFFSS